MNLGYRPDEGNRILLYPTNALQCRDWINPIIVVLRKLCNGISTSTPTGVISITVGVYIGLRPSGQIEDRL